MAKEYSVTKNGGQKTRAQAPASNAKDGGQRKTAQSPTAQRVQGNGSSVSKSGTPKYRTIEETMDLLGVGQKKDRYSFKAEQEERRAQQSMRQTVPETKKTAEKKPADWLGTLKYGARRGITAADSSVAKGVDWLVGGVADELHALGQSTLQSLGIDSDYFNGKDTLLDKYIAEGERRMEAQGRLRDEAAGDSKAAQKVGQYTEMVANSLPMSVMALLSGGTAAAPQASTAALKAASSIANSGKAWQTVKPIADAAVSMLKNPNWGFTFASTVGSSYDDAIADGASEDAASMYAILNAAFNATTEIGGTDDVLGGLQKLPAQLRKALEAGDKNLALRIIKNMPSEIGEEIVQGIGERGLKSLYEDVPLASTTDENAMFNPRSALEEAKGAAVVSAVLGGGQAAVQTAANAAANQMARRQTARTAAPVQENIPAADAADVMEQTAPVQSSAETGTQEAKPGARERAKNKRRREQRAKFQAETEFWDEQALYRMNHGYDAALPKELESTNFSNWVKKRTKAILKEGGGDYTVLPPWESDSGFAEASSPDSVNEGNVARHADAAAPGETFNAVDALADYGKPTEAAQTRTETQGDNPAPAKAESVKQAGSDVLNSVLNLNSKNTQPKMTTEQIYNEYFAPKTQPKPADNGTKAQKNTAPTQETASAKDTSNEIVAKLKNSIPNIQQEPIVSTLSGTEFAKGEKKLSEQVGEFFKSFGNKVFRSGLGNVILDERGVKSDIAHGIGRAKSLTFAAVPDVIASGKQIDFQKNWKGRGYDSYVFAAPVKIGDQTSYVAAVVLSDSNNRFYLHEVVDENGNLIYSTKKVPSTSRPGSPQTSGITGAEETNSVPGNSTSQVNPQRNELPGVINEAASSSTSIDTEAEHTGTNDISSDTSIPTTAQNVKSEKQENAGGTQGRVRNGSEDYEGSPKEKERGFSKNVRTDNAMDATIRESFDATPETYEQLANKDTLTKAKDIFSKGISEARSEVEQALGAAKSGSKLAPEMVPLARMVANELSKTGDVETARRILADVATELTAAGQLGQAGRILRNTDSNAALASIQKSIDAINTEFAKQHKRSKWRAELTEAETQEILSTDFTESGAYERIYEKVATRLGKEMPSSVLEKLTEIRRINMLLRPRTQIKNIASNTPMLGLRKGAETLSIGIQSALTKTGFMDKTDRTRGWASKEQRQLARDYYEANKADINGQSNKWDLKSALREKRTIFKGGAIEKAVSKMTGKEIDSFGEALRQVTYNCLEAGDAPFVKSAFVDSLSQYCAAKGITTEAGITQEAIDFATANAMEATFKNATVIADIVNRAKRNSSPAVSAAIDVLIPFTTTPANILFLMGDYSPVGFARMISKDGPAAKIDAFSKASVGTAMLALGFALRNAGIITGGKDDDKDKAALDKATGQGTYSIGGRVSYDWAQPVGSLLAFGAEIADAVKGQESWDSALMNAIYTAGDATLNLSLFQNIISVLRGSGKPTQQIIDAIMEGGATQLVPGLAGDIAKIIDGTVRSTYTGGNVFNDIGAKVLSTTPGFSKKLPASVNVRGEENTRGGLAARAANTLLNPTNYTGGKRNAVDEEIYRLYDATGSTVFFPSVSPYKIEYGNETYTMNGKDRETFQKVQGQTYYDLANPLLNSEMYKALSDEQKASVLKSIRDYALDAAKRQFVDGQGGEYSNSQWDPIAELTKGQISAYIPAKRALKDGADGKSDKKAYDAVDLLLDNYGKLPKAVQERLEGEDLNVDKLLYADALGIGSKDYYAASKAVSDGEAKLGTSDVAKAISVYNNMKGKSDGEILSAIKAQVPPAKGGKQSSTVRRIEAYSKLAGDDADLGKWLELCASLSDADENSSVAKADVYTAWANMGLGPKDKYAGIDRNGFYNIVKSNNSLASNPDYATQIDEVYALLVPAEEKTKPKLTGTVQGGAAGSKSVQHWSYEDIMESLGLAAKK